jgi:FKBP-type peptidyl-prolyl cis-trans isomerase
MSKLALGIAIFGLAITAAAAQDSTTQTTPPPSNPATTPTTKKPPVKKPATAATAKSPAGTSTATKSTATKSTATKSAMPTKSTTVHHTGTKATAGKTVAKKRTPVTKVDPNAPTPVTGAGTTTPTGLQYWDIKPGTGTTAAAGQKVEVQYTGWLTDGHKFDSSVGTGRNFAFMLGQGQVIKGWDEGVAGMKVGGKRQLRIPPQLAYGDRGFPGAIPAGSTLVFDVELMGVANQ